MKMQIFILIVAVLAMFTTNAQGVIAIQNGSSTKFKYLTNTPSGADITDALSMASNGDTLYLPGETFALLQPFKLDKKIVFVGTGIHEDSLKNVAGVSKTIFFVTASNSFTIENNGVGTDASGSEFHGISFTGNNYVRIGSTNNNQNVSNLQFIRCYFQYGLQLGKTTSLSFPSADNILIKQCYIKHAIDINGANNVQIIANVIERIQSAQPPFEEGTPNTLVANNLIFGYTNLSSIGGYANNGVTYQNNIFFSNENNAYTIDEPTGKFYNNLWISFGNNLPAFTAGTIHSSDENSTINGVFKNLNPSSYTVFSYQSNYELNPTHPKYTTFNNLGGAGPVGIYGLGGNKWKDGILPFNPHWTYFNNGNLGNTTINGLLNVTIKGSAQQD